MPSVELVTLSGAAGQHGRWDHGPQRAVEPTPQELALALSQVTSDAVLCLDVAFALPEADLLHRLLDGPCDAWHAGLRLGLEGQPRALDHVYPQWMLTTPADPDIETTSPFLSLRALLVRRTVLDQLGGPDPAMDTLSGSGIEMGIRWTRAGALVRHVPSLVPSSAEPSDGPSERDGFRCVARHHGRIWACWALARSVSQGAVSPTRAAGLAKAVRRTRAHQPPHFEAPIRTLGDTTRTVSVILPTLDRYPYLEPLLGQLARQSTAPHQVLIVDQTPKDRRREDLASVAPELPVTVMGLDEAGQSTARNLALHAATGEFVLFIDDDDEIDADLIADHLRRLTDQIDGICGGVDDATAGPPPPGFRHRRASDVFPTNNAMLRRDALLRSGLFDPAFDHGPRADRDIGIRLHLAGAVLVYDPSVMVFHHHAPAGGLRTHGARVMTRARARQSLTERQLPAATELYIGLRYYSAHQQREAKAVRILSTISGGGAPYRRVARALIQLALLPATLGAFSRTERDAASLFEHRRPIPTLADPPPVDRAQ